MIIDTHHHFWNYNPVEFDWIDDDMASIRRSFLPADLNKTIREVGVDGVISVQARQSTDETEWLLNLASENDFIKGIIGWVPLASNKIQKILEKYSSSKWLKGVRHVVQGEPDPDFILGKEFNTGIKLLKASNLIYEILIFEHQLPNTIWFVDQHPNQVFVLDHIAKPVIRENKIERTMKQLQPYFDVILEAFGPERLMFGSDWPVCLVAVQYKNWLEIVKSQISGLTQNEQDLILYKNAVNVYHL